MNTQSAPYVFGFHTLRAALHLPQRPILLASPGPMKSSAPTDWLERLAIWSERQPMHHHMGSYTQRR